MNNLHHRDNNRNKKSHHAVISGMVLNLLVFCIKLVVGLLISSVSVIADSFNNLTDALSNLIIMASIKLAAKPADREHPFGHGRTEHLTALILACAMIVVGIEFFRVSLDTLQNPHVIVLDSLFTVLLLSTALIKLFMWIYYHRIEKSTEFEPLKTLAVDSRNDVFITFFTIGSVFFTQLTGLMIDGYVGILISCLIIFSGYCLAKETISKLLGERPNTETARKILSLVESHEHILSSHDLIVHTYGPSITMATLHVEMSNHLTLDQAHSIIDKIERSVKKELLINLLLHIDPTPVADQRLIDIKEKTMSFLHSINPKMDAHDFKISDIGEQIHIVFEVVFPYEFDTEKEDIVIKSLTAIIQAINANYHVIIEPEYR